MNRADRRRLKKALDAPGSQEVINGTLALAIKVLQKEFGFGPVRIKRFKDGLENYSEEKD